MGGGQEITLYGHQSVFGFLEKEIVRLIFIRQVT
jgi:hypothetical protein